MRVLIETPTDGLEKIFSKNLGFDTTLATDYNNLPPEDDVDIVVFSGGSDVNPIIYGEKPHPKTRYDNERDKNSILLYHKYEDKIKIGVCRGAQFLCAYTGGKLAQHIEGHTSCRHEVIDLTSPSNITYTVLGDHHQACVHFGKGFFIEAISSNDGVVEAFSSAERKILGVQFHPEWGDGETEEYFWKLYNYFMFITKGSI